MTRLTVLFFGLVIAASSNAQTADHWETIVVDSAIWKYVLPVTEPDSNWTVLSFANTAWLSGIGGIGYGDGDDSTIVMGAPVFMRHTFNIANASNWIDLRLAVDYDDGYIAYLNGTEIARRNMGTEGSPVAFSDYSTGQHEAVLYANGTPESVQVSPSLLVTGTNILALQVHNRSAGSSDLTSRPFLFGGTSQTTFEFDPITPWFNPPLSFSTSLPLVVIDTEGQNILDDPRIVVHMGIIDNGSGNLNSVGDPFNEYDGLINIEIRGSSSQALFPKKQYALETQDTVGNSLDVSLLGLPIENDWILHAPYSDKTLMRNYLVYNWWRAMGWYTTKTKYCEVVINGDYKGVYILIEQIKWDNDRVDIEKIDGDDNQGDSLTGGYIFKVDKITGSGQYDWTSHIDTFQTQPKITKFQYDYPNRDTITPEQEEYLQQFVYDWEQSLIDSTFTQPDSGYRHYVDVNSFIDYFLLQEITKNVDGYRLSTYLNKQRDSRGGKLQVGPAWDFNIALGNANYCQGSLIENYALDFPCDQSLIPFWWQRMNQDSIYWEQVKCRYAELRSDMWDIATINAQIDSNVVLLGDAASRNFQRWDILDTYIWPNSWIAGSYPNEIDSLKTWIEERLTWLDGAIGLPAGNCQSASNTDVTISEINYHSSDTLNTEDWFELQNLTSDTLDISFWTLYDDNEFNTFTFPMGTYILPDSFLVVARKASNFEPFYPDITNRVGSFNWGIGNGGDHLTLRDFQNDFVLSVNFDDEAPWPIEPDGNSHTLEKWDWATDLNDPASWFAGCLGGSPGRSFTECVYASIEDEEDENGFRLYPNPATDQVWIELENPATLSVYSLSGKQLLRLPVVEGRNLLNVSVLASGMYLVEVITHDKSRFTKRFIVN